MSQTWTDDIYDPDHEADNDLQNMENNFAALKSTFSGTSAPANTVAGMQWFDTSNKVLKVRDTGDSAWYGLMHGDTSQKVWVYRNDAMDGWVVDSSVSDRVLALKGGSTYTTGAGTAGGWTISGLSGSGGSHNHSFSVPDHVHSIPRHDVETGSAGGYTTVVSSDSTGSSGSYSGTTGSSTVSVSVSSDGSWRPAAAVGTLQRLNL